MLGQAPDLSVQLGIQSSELDQLRSQAARAPEKALKAAAQQFEALFLNTLLKSMRDASAGEGLFDSEQTKLYTSMLDQQFAQTLSKRGIGLAEMMVQQLSQQMGATGKPDAAHNLASPPLPPTSDSQAPGQPSLPPRPNPYAGLAASAMRSVANTPTPPAEPQRPPEEATRAQSTATPREFVERVVPHARAVAEDLGIPMKFLLGQAALESGWGRREPRFSDGSSSHNLFGIKADRAWKGAVIEVTTTEYVNGRAEVVKDRFRAYGSYADSLRDYADFLRSNPRYAQVLEGKHDAVGFARSLQQAGYATDPRYAEKLASVINGPSMRASVA